MRNKCSLVVIVTKIYRYIGIRKDFCYYSQRGGSSPFEALKLIFANTSIFSGYICKVIRTYMQSYKPLLFANTSISDAAWRQDSKSAGLAWIFSDQGNTEITRSSSAQDHVSSPCMAEALAIREALLHAAALSYSHICHRTDSQVLARVINRRSSTIELFGILSDIGSLIFSPSSPFTSCNVVFVSRLANGPTDHLAKAQLQSHLGVNFRA